MLLKPYSPLSYCWDNLIKKRTSEELSVEDVINLYQGFEGELIDILLIPEDEIEQNEIIEKLDSEITKKKLTTLLVLDTSDSFPKTFENSAKFVGYDVGICDEDTGFYSSIFNEILFGKITELTSIQKQLNNALLFNSLTLAEKYVMLHAQLAIDGKDVESYQPMSVYAIWKYSPTN